MASKRIKTQIIKAPDKRSDAELKPVLNFVARINAHKEKTKIELNLSKITDEDRELLKRLAK